jgi:hypothetical protein
MLSDLIQRIEKHIFDCVTADLRFAGKSVFICHGLNEDNSRSVLEFLNSTNFDIGITLDPLSRLLLTSHFPGSICYFIDDIFTAEQLLELRSIGFEFEDNLHRIFKLDKSDRELFEADLLYYRCFLQELVLEFALVFLCQKSAPTQVSHVRYKTAPNDLSAAYNFAFGSVLQRSGIAMTVEVPLLSGLATKDVVCKNLKRVTNEILSFLFSWVKRRIPSVILICHSRFYWHTKPFVSKLFKPSDKGVFALITDESNGALLRQFPLDMLSGKLHSFLANSETRQDCIERQGIDSCIAVELDETWFAGYLGNDFVSLVNSRLRFLRRLEIFYSGIIQFQANATIVTTNLNDCHSSMVRLVCKRLGRGVKVLPHGYLGAAARAGYLHGDYFVGTPYARHVLLSQRVPTHNIVLDPRVDAPNEYKVSICVPHEVKNASSKCKVLVVFDPVEMVLGRVANCLLSSFGYSSQVTGLRACTSLMTVADVQLFFKAHPGSDETDLYDYADSKIRQNLLPRSAPLIDSAKSVDLIICINYLGIALKHLTEARLPIIHLVTSERVGVYRANEHPFDSKPLLDAGLLARSEIELQKMVCRFIADEAYAFRLSEMSGDFYQRWFGVQTVL